MPLPLFLQELLQLLALQFRTRKFQSISHRHHQFRIVQSVNPYTNHTPNSLLGRVKEENFMWNVCGGIRHQHLASCSDMIILAKYLNFQKLLNFVSLLLQVGTVIIYRTRNHVLRGFNPPTREHRRARTNPVVFECQS